MPTLGHTPRIDIIATLLHYFVTIYDYARNVKYYADIIRDVVRRNTNVK